MSITGIVDEEITIVSLEEFEFEYEKELCYPNDFLWCFNNQENKNLFLESVEKIDSKYKYKKFVYLGKINEIFLNNENLKKIPQLCKKVKKTLKEYKLKFYIDYIKDIYKNKLKKKQELHNIELNNRMELYMQTTNVHLKNIHDSLSLEIGKKIACIYLIKIGNYSNVSQYLEKTHHDKSNKIVYKYGKSDDFARRLTEHNSFFNVKLGLDSKVMCFSLVDNQYTRKAESEIQLYVENKYQMVKFKETNSKETFICTKEELKKIKKKYTEVGNKYYEKLVHTRHQLDLKNKDLKLKNKDIEQLEQKNEQLIQLKNKDIQLKDKDIELKDKDIELKDKNIEQLEQQNKELIQLKDNYKQQKKKQKRQLDKINKELADLKLKNQELRHKLEIEELKSKFEIQKLKEELEREKNKNNS